jgi:glycosyltransferase involved in cell wall biosynthesis
VVIDNGSSDSTEEICRSMGVECISHCVNTGGSMGTVMTYFINAFRKGYDVVCQFDGDGQHVAAELPKIIRPIQNGSADYVIGSRFLEGEGFQSTSLRKTGIRLFSSIMTRIMRKRITDVTSGFRAYNRKVMALFAKKIRMELHDVNQLLLLCHFNDMRVAEVPVVMRERMKGTSEFNIVNSILFPIKGVVNILGCYLQRRDIRRIR